MQMRRGCPNCGTPMVPVVGSTQRGNEWARWHCPHCLHEETVRECPHCHESRVPLTSDGHPVCPACGRRYE